jgi:hypothetical protein
MKIFFLILAISATLYSCGSGNSTINGTSAETAKNDTIRIANDSLQYDIMIIENGFDSWLITQPKRGFYGQAYLETKNRMFVSEYNNRVLQPQQYSSNLYTERINYESAVDYGYEVNYLLYNYFVYFQDKYNQKFIGGRN